MEEGVPTPSTRPSRHRLLPEGGSRTPHLFDTVRYGAVIALLVALPLGTTPLELANGFALAVALAVLIRDRSLDALVRAPLAGPAAALALGWLLLAPGPGGSVLASLGRVWALTPIWTVPILLATPVGRSAASVAGSSAASAPNGASEPTKRGDGGLEPAAPPGPAPVGRSPASVAGSSAAPAPDGSSEPPFAWGGDLGRLGTSAALVAVAWVVVELAIALCTTGWTPPRGPFSHHLTLAYALLPAFAAALGQSRPVVAVALAAAILATGSAGAVVAVATTAAVWAAASRGRAMAGAAALGGVALALVGMITPWFADELGRRAVLWTGAARVAVGGGTPPGTWREVIAPVHREIAPGFDFPHHAHDTAIQAAADAGPAAWIALSWGAVVLWQRAPAWVLAGAAGLAVGSLTQDLIGDLEVVRAAAIWASLATTGALPSLGGTATRAKVSDGSP